MSGRAAAVDGARERLEGRGRREGGLDGGGREAVSDGGREREEGQWPGGRRKGEVGSPARASAIARRRVPDLDPDRGGAHGERLMWHGAVAEP